MEDNTSIRCIFYVLKGSGNMTSKESFVYQQFVEIGRTDNFIASVLGVTRSAITHFRKYHGIHRKDVRVGELGEQKTINQLKSVGFSVKDMNKYINKIHPYDLLINNQIKVDVKTANRGNDRAWRFALTNRIENGNAESERYIKLKNGRMKKVLTKSCDFLVLCALNGTKQRYFIVPTKEIPKNHQNISLTTEGKWSIWEDRWDLIANYIREVS